MKSFQFFFKGLGAVWLLMAAVVPVHPAWSSPMKPGSPTSARLYHLDPRDSRFFVRTGTGGVFGAFGHKHTIMIPDFSGEVSLDPNDLSQAFLRLKIPSRSLFVEAKKKKEAKDKPKIEKVMREEVLEVTAFPEISFSSTRVTAASSGPDGSDVEILGDLSLHGVTRNIPITAHVTVDKDRLTAQGSFKLKQSDYRIQPVSVAGGAVKVKDEIQLNFELVALP